MLTFAPINIPVGMMNMLTTACSKPWAKNVTMGNQAAAILPTVEVEVIAITTPRQTSQLHRMALTNEVTRPAKPSASYPPVLASATLTILAATPAGATCPMLVRAIASRAPYAMLPRRLPRNTQAQFAITPPQPDFRSSTASGTSAKLPVTSSSPSSTIITKPTGNTSAPTNGWPVVTAAPNARLGAAPGSAPERAPRMRRARDAG